LGFKRVEDFHLLLNGVRRLLRPVDGLSLQCSFCIKPGTIKIDLQVSSYVVVDSAVGVKREVDRKFGRHEKHAVLLPYHEELICELDARFDHIKHGLVTAVLVNEQRPALRNFVFALKTFISTHGFRFSKEEHIQLIQLLYLILVRKDQWPDIVTYAAKALEDLVNRSYFTYEDLTLEWEPLYNLYYGANYGKLEEIEGKNLRNAVFRLKRFYRPSDTPQIWNKIETCFADDAFVGAQNVAVPSNACFPEVVGNRSDTELLSDLLIADAVCARFL
ncbi:hypothetical protein ANCDUO_09840, partial [Ancylostoma duodenale]